MKPFGKLQRTIVGTHDLLNRLMRYLFFFLLGGLLFAQKIEDPLVTTDWEAQEKWVDSVYAQMSNEEKIG